jgi:hemerythrin-like domain-containing protein
LAAGDAVPKIHLEQIVELIQVFADKCHHGKEEDLLFVEMNKIGFPKESGPIAVMLQEHQLGRGFVREMAKATQEYGPGKNDATKAFEENARGYVSLLQQHIQKENIILFPMADSNIAASVQKRLMDDFERVEIEKIGAGKHEELHKIIDSLKSTYLKK